MENIEVGEWVRSKIGSIGKVTKIEDRKFLYEDKSLITFIGNVVKHSKNIIDLIEVGDIVNKSEVYEIGQSENGQKWIHTCRGFLYYEEDLEKVTILTHEQYEQNCYKVNDVKTQ